MSISLALIGDYNEKVDAHIAIPRALEFVRSALNIDLDWSWVETDSITNKTDFTKFQGLWATPGSPYNNMEGVLNAIQFARESQRPFLGTCGGFQHALIEYARSICGLTDADHAESNPEGHTLIVSRLSCSLAGKNEEIYFTPGSQLHKIFHEKETKEAYQCNFGLNPEWKSRLEKAGIHFTGLDKDNQVRAFELPTHPFFIGTLFQPELSARTGKQHPLITAFVEKCR
jgi:CTP synthase (UTP-ammonia lyase)